MINHMISIYTILLSCRMCVNENPSSSFSKDIFVCVVMDLIPSSCDFLSCGYCFCDKSYDLHLSAVQKKNKEPYFPKQNIPFTLSLVSDGNVVIVRLVFFYNRSLNQKE